MFSIHDGMLESFKYRTRYRSSKIRIWNMVNMATKNRVVHCLQLFLPSLFLLRQSWLGHYVWVTTVCDMWKFIDFWISMDFPYLLLWSWRHSSDLWARCLRWKHGMLQKPGNDTLVSAWIVEKLWKEHINSDKNAGKAVDRRARMIHEGWRKP